MIIRIFRFYWTVLNQCCMLDPYRIGLPRLRSANPISTNFCLNPWGHPPKLLAQVT